MDADASGIDQAARDILTGNDRGGYTVPSARLYPFQWNWDSAFSALGFATFDEDRAWQEIETLFEAQWPDGMVPHIVFRADDPGYFPGPGVWGTSDLELPWPSSGISQPAFAASAAKWIYERSADRSAARRRLAALLPKLVAWHEWWHRARDPDGLGIMVVSHPWESGRDNLPDWDRPGAAIDVSSIGDYSRRDTDHVDPAMRPHKADYDRYLALVSFGRERGWDSKRIAAESPFWVADVGATSILLRAERDARAVALEFGETALAETIATRIARMEAGYHRLWNPDAGAFCSLDLRTGQHAEGATSASLLCLYAGVGGERERRSVIELAETWAGRVRYLTPSFDPTSPNFDERRYWRGPVWPMINFLIAIGLTETGHHDLAERLRQDTARLIANEGFCEYYSPLDGTSAGGGAFSWTAAIWLAWASPNSPNVKRPE